jgi:hypothetical protein
MGIKIGPRLPFEKFDLDVRIPADIRRQACDHLQGL